MKPADLPSLPVGASYVFLREVKDPRGDLIVCEVGEQLPFVPQRVFFIHNVPNQQTRGEHAHKECHQVLVCQRGSVRVLVENAAGEKAEVTLDSPSLGVHIEPMLWAAQENYSSDAVLMVLASHRYDERDYIRNYGAWKRMADA